MTIRTPVLQQPRYVARFVNGVNVVLDLHSKLHSKPYSRLAAAQEAALALNMRTSYGGSPRRL